MIAVCALSAVRAVPSPSPSLPENYQARARMSETIFAPVSQAASARRAVVLQDGGGEKVFFRSDIQEGHVYLVFSRPGAKESPTASAGNYIIKRSLSNGAFVQVKVFLQDDPGCYVRLFPAEAGRSQREGESPGRGRTEMDVFINGEPFQRGIVIARPFEELLTAPFLEIVELTEGTVDWPLVLPAERTAGDERLEKMVKLLRPRLKSLRDVEDGAMDTDGRFVFIRDGRAQQPGKGGLNCSGFAKFVVDGFYKPLTGKLADVGALKERNLDTRGNRWSSVYEEDRDPYFGLDWARNLARILAVARTGERLPPAEFADVRGLERFPYVEDVGYPIESLGPILYLLARREPGFLYIGSLNREAEDGTPVRQHHHLAVFFPYIDEKSVTRVVVMERNVETSVASLQNRFPRDSVHLVRIDSEGDFAPPQ